MNEHKLIKARRWMFRALNQRVSEYRVGEELNCTKLAEDCAEDMDLYEDHVDYKIPEELFDLAVKVTEEWEETYLSGN